MVENLESNNTGEEGTSSPRRKKVAGPPLKIVMRRLPPTMTSEDLLIQLAPLPEYDYFLLAPADYSLQPWAYARAYFRFKSIEDVVSFKDRFDGYVFVDASGAEFPVLVEIAPCQKIPKCGPETATEDLKCNTIEQSFEYKKFLEDVEKENIEVMPSLEQRLQEVELMKKEKQSLHEKPTLLIEFLLQEREKRVQRRKEKLRQKEDERLKRIEERKKQEERDRRRKEREERDRKEREREARHNTEDKSSKSTRKADVAPRFSKTRDKDYDEYCGGSSRDKGDKDNERKAGFTSKSRSDRYTKTDGKVYEKDDTRKSSSRYSYDYYNKKSQSRSDDREEKEYYDHKSTRKSDKPKYEDDGAQDYDQQRTGNRARPYREKHVNPPIAKSTTDRKKETSDRYAKEEKKRPQREGNNEEEKKRTVKPSMQIYQPGAARRRKNEEKDCKAKDDEAN